jgi:hypothetical protein
MNKKIVLLGLIFLQIVLSISVLAGTESELNISATLVPLPAVCGEGDLTCQTIYQAGAGTGAFLSAIYLPLGNLILILGIIAGAVAIFMGVAYVIKNVISRSD